MLVDDTPVADEEIVEYDKVSNNGGEGEDDYYYGGFYGFGWSCRVGFCYETRGLGYPIDSEAA